MLLNMTYLWLYGLKAVCFSFCCNYSVYVCELRWVTFTRNDTESQQWMPVLLKSQTPSIVYGILHWEGAEKWCLGCAKEYVKLINTRCQRPLVCMYHYNRFIQFLLLYYNIPECMGMMRIMSLEMPADGAGRRLRPACGGQRDFRGVPQLCHGQHAGQTSPLHSGHLRWDFRWFVLLSLLCTASHLCVIAVSCCPVMLEVLLGPAGKLFSNNIKKEKNERLLMKHKKTILTDMPSFKKRTGCCAPLGQ